MKTFQSDDPAKCAEAIVDRVGRHIRLGAPIGIGKPNQLLNALYRIAEADRRVTLEIFTGISLARPPFRTDLERRFVGPLLNRLFPAYPELLYVQALRERRLPDNVEVREFFLQAGAWLSHPIMQQSYTSLNYSHVAGHLMRAETNAFAQLVAPDPHGDAGRLSLSSNTDVTLDMVPYVKARREAGKPVVFAGEVNANLPYMPGEAEVERGQLDVLLESAQSYDLFAPPKE
ncbi:MAG TPA: acetyl-CoA hydrolase, partial [Hyphomicrobiaceae bacterium]|nr:acetyl-CoA hydrolase [Hyphomicrobiaceae bacterium]